jgi:hypothetical protein
VDSIFGDIDFALILLRFATLRYVATLKESKGSTREEFAFAEFHPAGRASVLLSCRAALAAVLISLKNKRATPLLFLVGLRRFDWSFREPMMVGYPSFGLLPGVELTDEVPATVGPCYLHAPNAARLHYRR